MLEGNYALDDLKVVSRHLDEVSHAMGVARTALGHIVLDSINTEPQPDVVLAKALKVILKHSKLAKGRFNVMNSRIKEKRNDL